jgi:hypothetical protein
MIKPITPDHRDARGKVGYTVKMNYETYALLVQVQEDMKYKLGFEPTMGQVIRHLVVNATGEK